ncbi:hypothetical protein NGC85_02830 [Acinetobacter sp. Z1]|uniref:hypothetical protein n=1 Tax=Acinetobacter sp. Z1 TaxID=2953738 RepID=UPI0020C93F22|nr:hypothetical protein [Acinetobacter sp. Z1]UTO20053.1 hypothetical protein NGC85_02830 [Acinetobacter sp. Z1]
MKQYYFAAIFSAVLLGGCSSSPAVSNQLSVGSLRESDAATDVTIAVDADQDGSHYGGIKSQYVVKGCKVTIYNDGPIQMVNEKTDQPCNAPIRKDHQFSKTTRTYQENGCTVTESVAADGLSDAVIDCSKKK